MVQNATFKSKFIGFIAWLLHKKLNKSSPKIQIFLKK